MRELTQQTQEIQLAVIHKIVKFKQAVAEGDIEKRRKAEEELREAFENIGLDEKLIKYLIAHFKRATEIEKPLENLQERFNKKLERRCHTMLKEVRFIEELGLWLATFGDINLLYDDITRDYCLKPKEIADGIVLLRELGVGKIYDFYVDGVSNVNTTRNFFLYRMLDSEVILVRKLHKLLAFEENGQTVYKPDKVRYFCYRNTEIYHIYPRNVYHVYYEGVKLILPNDDEIVISPAYSKSQ